MEDYIAYMPIGIVSFQKMQPYNIIYVNDMFWEMTQTERIEPDGWNDGLWGLVHEEDRKLLRSAYHETLSKGISHEYEVRIRNVEGEYRWYVLRMSQKNSDESNPVFIIVVWDVHERKLMEEELYVQTERYRLMETITGELPFDLDVESREILVSRKYLDMRGMSDTLEHFAKEDEMMGLVYKADREKMRSTLAEALEEEIKGNLEIRLLVSAEGHLPEYAWYRLTYKSIPGINGGIIRIVGRLIDINQEKIEHFRLSERIRHDALTGLLNRIAIKEEVERLLEQSVEHSHALLLLDLDNFKEINETFGHMFGDTVLLGVAEKLLHFFRRDDIIGRVGGDEFLILMKNVRASIAMEKAWRLCKELRRSYQSEKKEVKISCSIGISFFDENGSHYDELFEKADFAMYQAKEAGKNRCQAADLDERLGEEGHARRGSEENEDYAVVKVQDESFLSSAFSLLAHAKDINGSLDLLLDRIGTRYDLDEVTVLEENEREYIQTNAWVPGGGTPDPNELADRTRVWERFTSNFDERGLFYVDVEHDKEVPTTGIEGMSRAFVCCRFQCQDEKYGMVIFRSREPVRIWSEIEKETFLEIGRIISVFVSLRRTQNENEYTIRSLKRLDPLTGLYNESTFRECAQEVLDAMDPTLRYAVVYTDIRDFSYINENFGMKRGNEVLQAFAQTISNVDKVISGRLHSDLFVSLLWGGSQEQILQDIQQNVLRFVRDQHELYPDENLRLVTGVYFVEQGGEDIDAAIENANLARKKCKQANGQLFGVYTQEIRREREEEKRIMGEFEPALQGGQFLAYVQPKFELESMTTSGGEALVRWQKPNGEMVYPDMFIPVLERTGYIVQLDFYMFDQVLRHMKQWEDEGKQLYRISVNFSRKHFEGQGIYHRICEMTDKYHLEHKWIEVEITESLLVSGLDKVRDEMVLLREAGFAVAIDDFGTGYSSLSMLHDMPADVVKIDKSFLREDMMSNKEFIRHIGELIHSVKEETIVEGVETQEQAQFLVDCGFHFGQGYLYSRPIPIEVFGEKYIK